MALVFAVVGFYQYETKTIFQNAKLHQSNIYAALFRVNSVFFDPSIYGRFLVVALIPTAVLIVRGARLGASASPRSPFAAVAWLGLLISFSQSSFAALLVAVFALSAVVWRWKSLFALAAVLVVAAGIAVTQPHADACAAPSHDLGPQRRHERAGESDRGGDQDRRRRTRRTASASVASSTRTRSARTARRGEAPRTTRR